MTKETLFARLQCAFDTVVEYGARDMRAAGADHGNLPAPGSPERTLFDAHYNAAMAYLDALRALRQPARRVQ